MVIHFPSTNIVNGLSLTLAPPLPGRNPVVRRLICTSIIVHLSTFVSTIVPWSLWIETRLAFRAQYPCVEYPSAAGKGGSRYHPTDNSRIRSGCMKNTARLVSVESSRLSSYQSPFTQSLEPVWRPTSPPFTLANAFFVVRPVSLTARSGPTLLLFSRLTLNPSSLKPHTLLQLRRTLRR